MRFSDNFLAEVAERNDIVDVVSNYVNLEKRSGANRFGCCPFHSERTPSFCVTPDRQTYHCFGCGKGGGVFNFIMEIENLSFPEAVEFLAKRAGMELPVEDDGGEGKRRARMLALNKDAARFFYEQLNAPAGAPAREYMAGRRISRATAVNFGLGFAPNEWGSLLDAMRKKGYHEEELFVAGLVRRGRNGGFYDVFRNRLMFPVIDVRGNVIAFSGRFLGEGDEKAPKYLNSPDTLVFNKGRNLFALNLAKKSKCGYIILSEGNVDVVSLHQAGFDCAVASLGTSLTAEQARLISRFTNQVIIAYDNDGAGIKAAQKAIGIFEKLEVSVKVLRVSGAKDPDEFIKRYGADAFRNLINGSENKLDYQLQNIRVKYDLESDEGRLNYVKEAADMLARQSSEVARQVYAGKVAQAAGLKSDAVIHEVERRRKEIIRSTGKGEAKKLARPTQQVQPKDSSIKYADPESAAAEEGLIRLLLLDPSLAARPRLPEPESFTSPELGNIYRALLTRIRENRPVDLAMLSGELSSEEMSLLVSLRGKPETAANAEEAFTDYLNRMNQIQSRKNPTVDLRSIAESLRDKKAYRQEDN